MFMRIWLKPTKLLLLTFFALSSLLSHAFKVTPMVAEFEATGDKATQNFVVLNTQQEEIAVEVLGQKRGYDSSGEETRSDSLDLSIYPPQFTLKPGAKRLVRISYIGSDKSPQTEIPFRIIFQQLPVNLIQEKVRNSDVNLKFLLRYVASAYVLPKERKAQLKVMSIKQNKNQLELNLLNTGNTHVVLSGIKIKFENEKTSSTPYSVLASDHKVLAAENLLPGMTKTYKLSLKGAFPKDLDQRSASIILSGEN